MYTADELKQMIFIDIETTTQTKTFSELIQKNPALEEYWNIKTTQLRDNQPTDLADFRTPAQMWPRMAGLYPEWGKIVCISMGQIQFDETGHPVDFKAVSFHGDDEASVLKDFAQTAAKIMQKYPKMKWVGHNIKGFDMPYIIKRSLINSVNVPVAFHLHKQKPWENCLLDTQDVWKFGGWNSAKLGLISELLGIPSPKDAMSGPEVNEYYWDGRLEEIKTYCEKDIQATANIILKMASMPIV
jgi:uncharacterized protein YprB with RNaseH-like and TPR domain